MSLSSLKNNDGSGGSGCHGMMMELCKKAVDFLKSDKLKKINYLFLEPFDLSQVPDYLDIVERKLDLTTLGKNLQSGKYRNHYEFFDDAALIFHNAIKYHSRRDDTKWIVKPANQMLKQVQKLRDNAENRKNGIVGGSGGDKSDREKPKKKKSSFKIRLPSSSSSSSAKGDGGGEGKTSSSTTSSTKNASSSSGSNKGESKQPKRPSLSASSANASNLDAVTTSKPKVSLKLKPPKKSSSVDGGEKKLAIKSKSTQPKFKLKLSLSKKLPMAANAAAKASAAMMSSSSKDTDRNKKDGSNNKNKIKIKKLTTDAAAAAAADATANAASDYNKKETNTSTNLIHKTNNHHAYSSKSETKTINNNTTNNNTATNHDRKTDDKPKKIQVRLNGPRGKELPKGVTAAAAANAGTTKNIKKDTNKKEINKKESSTKKETTTKKEIKKSGQKKANSKSTSKSGKGKSKKDKGEKQTTTPTNSISLSTDATTPSSANSSSLSASQRTLTSSSSSSTTTPTNANKTQTGPTQTNTTTSTTIKASPSSSQVQSSNKTTTTSKLANKQMAPMTPARKIQCMKVLSGLRRRKNKSIIAFQTPVSEKSIINDYRAKIKHPMDLATITNKLEKNEYSTVSQFVLDVRRIFANCLRFNTNVEDSLREKAIGCLLMAEELMSAFLVTKSETQANVYPPLLYCWKSCIQYVLEPLYSITNPDDGQPTTLYFQCPVSFYFGGSFPSDYLNKVKRPMDFGTITSTLIEGHYENVDQFTNDCKLVIDNCNAYYRNSTNTTTSANSASSASTNKEQTTTEDRRRFLEYANRLNTSLHQQLDIFYRYLKSPTGGLLELKKSSNHPLQTLPKPSIPLLLSVVNDLRAIHYTDKATKITEPAMAPFEKPVSLAAYPDYLKFVQTPMDLQTVERKIKGNFYETPEDFEYDIQLIFRNCEVYNTQRKGDHLVSMSKYAGKQFRKLFVAKMRTLEDLENSDNNNNNNNANNKNNNTKNTTSNSNIKNNNNNSSKNNMINNSNNNKQQQHQHQHHQQQQQQQQQQKKNKKNELSPSSPTAGSSPPTKKIKIDTSLSKGKSSSSSNNNNKTTTNNNNGSSNNSNNLSSSGGPISSSNNNNNGKSSGPRISLQLSSAVTAEVKSAVANKNNSSNNSSGNNNNNNKNNNNNATNKSSSSQKNNTSNASSTVKKIDPPKATTTTNNQPVPTHIAIARVKEGFPLRRTVKNLNPWEADCARFFKELMRHSWISAARPKFIFHVPVTLLYPDLKDAYAEKVRKPMDLTTVECALLAGKYYVNPEAFVQDVALVFSNAIRFNKDGRDIGDPLSCAYYDASIHLLRYSRWLSLELLSEHVVPSKDEQMDIDEATTTDAGDVIPPFSWRLNEANRKKARQEMESLVLNEPIDKSVEGDRYTWMEVECEKLLKALRHQTDLRYMTYFIQPNYPADYAAFISKPMDWERVQRSLKNRDYDKFGDIIDDLRLIFSNALKYNSRLKGTDTVSGRAYEAAKYMSAKLEVAINKLMLSVSDRLERERIDNANAEREMEAAERAEEARIRAAWKSNKEGSSSNSGGGGGGGGSGGGGSGGGSGGGGGGGGSSGAGSSSHSRLDTSASGTASGGSSGSGGGHGISQIRIRASRKPIQSRRETTDFEIPFFDDEDDGQHEQSYFDVVKQQKSIFERQRKELLRMRESMMICGSKIFANLVQREMAVDWLDTIQKQQQQQQQQRENDNCLGENKINNYTHRNKRQRLSVDGSTTSCATTTTTSISQQQPVKIELSKPGRNPIQMKLAGCGGSAKRNNKKRKRSVLLDF